MKISGVLFDLDGVLLDTEGNYTTFWDGVNRRYPTGVENFAHVIKGTTLPTILNTYFPSEPIQQKIRAELLDHEQNMPFVPFDGVFELLDLLHRSGRRIAVVTSSNREKMNRVFRSLPRLEQSIDTLVTDEDISASKPDPEGYLLAAARLCLPKGEYAVVEDSIAGLRAGRDAGGYVIGIATTNPREKIAPLADHVADSVSELINLFAE